MMKAKLSLLFLFLFFSQFFYSQKGFPIINNQLDVYPDPPSYDGINRHSDDYTVRVRVPGGQWKDLYEYKTNFDAGSYNRKRGNPIESSFITFSFSGEVEIEITDNLPYIYHPFNLYNPLIRPLSENINISLINGSYKFTISEPKKLLFQRCNDCPHRSLSIFANEIKTPPSNPTITFKNDSLYETTDDLDWYYDNVQDNDIIYFEPGAILKGGLRIHDKQNVKIYGYGILDMTHINEKNYYGVEGENGVSNQYNWASGLFITQSNDIIVNDIIVNDSQHYGIDICNGSGFDIDNVKILGRVIWGDGITIKSCHDVNVNDCFIRTADDCISIYARKEPWATSETTGGISIEDCTLFADFARPINIGDHGSFNINDPKHVWNINFNNIEILNAKEPLIYYQGAIAINCGDENVCSDITFSDINIEDVEGTLFKINILDENEETTESNGKKIKNILFNGITYNGSNSNIVIKGLDCERNVDGVHFNNTKINGSYLLSDSNFETNSHVNNITFEEPNNFSTIIQTGYYTIKNYVGFDIFLSQQEHLYTSTIYQNNSQNIDAYEVWYIENLNNGHYLIKSVGSGYYMEDTYLTSPLLNNCYEHLVYAQSNYNLWDYKLRWKIVPNGYYDAYSIINVYSKTYLKTTNQIFDSLGTSEVEFLAATGSKDETLPRFSTNWWWKIEPYNGAISSRILSNNSISQKNNYNIYPTITENSIAIENNNLKNEFVVITDVNGRAVHKTLLKNSKNNINISNLNAGAYLLTIVEKNGVVKHRQKIIKK